MTYSLTTAEVAQRYGIKASTVRNWWARGILPHPMKTKAGLRWRVRDLERREAEWIAEARRVMGYDPAAQQQGAKTC